MKVNGKEIDVHKWFPFLNSYTLNDEIWMKKLVRERLREIKIAEKMSKGLPQPLKEIKSCEC